MTNPPVNTHEMGMGQGKFNPGDGFFPHSRPEAPRSPFHDGILIAVTREWPIRPNLGALKRLV
ncbi:hypothetical protein [Bordetella sp. H567]|uniref:hypothetical protein n=1 Tax=Bordetella sp. H567 TaxID=1697043 RepID=UPI0011AB8CFE|nr:hypothetical protein [Bordetella sp. H567]